MIKFLSTFLFTLVSTTAHAQVNSGVTAWILSSSALVLFMTLPGLALFYAGLVQSKNVLSVLCQHFGVACLMSIIIAVDIIRIKLKVDDSLDVFAVHGVGGILGTILCGFLISSSWGGVGFDDGLLTTDHVKIQFYAVLVTIIWTVITTYAILKLISLFTSLRVDEENEIEGLDTSTHGESGYNN